MAKTRQTGTEFIDALPDDGERRLMLAVLIDAIRTLSSGGLGLPPRRRLAWLRDRAWMQRDDLTEPFSFINICAALGINAGYVRRRVRQLQEQNAGLRLHRYAAKVEESWERQRRTATEASPSKRSSVVPLTKRNRRTASASASGSKPRYSFETGGPERQASSA